MYIISKHKDFYDMVAGQKGIDKTIVFERHILTLSYNANNVDAKHWYVRPTSFPVYGGSRAGRYRGLSAGDKTFKVFLVGFCGKIYVCAKVSTVVKGRTPFESAFEVHSHIHGIDRIKEAVCEYFNNDKYFDEQKSRWSNHQDLQHVIECTTNPKLLELFHTHKTPQFILYAGEKDNLHINGNLKLVEFFKLFDPFMAFQEIEMYITGVLGINNKPMVEISDKDKIAGHGFDPKYSFRKEPEDKKK